MSDETWIQIGKAVVKVFIPLIVAYLAWQVHWCQRRIALLRDQLTRHERIAETAVIEIRKMASDVEDVRLTARGYMANVAKLAEKCAKDCPCWGEEKLD